MGQNVLTSIKNDTKSFRKITALGSIKILFKSILFLKTYKITFFNIKLV